MAPNKMQGHFWQPSFWPSFFRLFHMVASMAAPISSYFKDSDCLMEEFWPIRKWFKKLPWRAKLRQPYCDWKSLKSWVRGSCQKLPCILFGVTYRENKQWEASARSSGTAHLGVSWILCGSRRSNARGESAFQNFFTYHLKKSDPS